jgi:Uri superfamily endonuclease|tara:strand:- start:94 stop:447 length:354 start_codon:yes stop_codon:yes gene_type:complete
MSDRLFYQLIHHFEHLILYSLVLWQIYFILKWLLKYVSENFKFESKIISPQTQVIEHISKDKEYTKESIKKDLGAIDVKVDKNIFIDKPDKVKVKLDEVKKGKVKTQKDKLKKLRGK